MPVRGAGDAGRAARDDRAHLPSEVHGARGRQAARRAPRLGRAAGVRLARGEPDPGRLARLGQGAPRPGRAARGHVARRVARPAGVGRGAQEQRLRRLRARRSARTSTCGSATSSASTALRRAVRRRSSTTTSRDEDRDGPPPVRLPEGAPGAARARRSPSGTTPSGRRRARSRSSCRTASSSRCCRSSASTTTRGGSTRPCTRSPRGDGHQRHPRHDALLPAQPRRPLRDDARVRPRPLRAPGRRGARAHAARARRVARPARVAEPDVGEPRRPLAAVLARLLPAAAGDLPGRARRLGRRAAGTAR